jgi:hypothetical protein
MGAGDPEAIGGRYGLAHIDPEAGELTAAVDLGRRQPKAVVAAGDGAWVIAADGSGLLVKSR